MRRMESTLSLGHFSPMLHSTPGSETHGAWLGVAQSRKYELRFLRSKKSDMSSCQRGQLTGSEGNSSKASAKHCRGQRPKAGWVLSEPESSYVRHGNWIFCAGGRNRKTWHTRQLTPGLTFREQYAEKVHREVASDPCELQED